MKRLITSLALCTVLTCVSILAAASTITLFGKKSPPQEDRQVAGFSAISSAGSFDVIITMGNKESLRMEGDESVMDEIETKVEDGTLKIRFKNNKNLWKWNNKGKVTVYVNAKSLNGLSLSGSGDMQVKGAIKGEKLDTRVSGSGNMVFTANVTDFNAAISGSGNMTANGSAGTSEIAVSGSGNFTGKNLKTDETNIRVSGSGNVSIYADKSLNAKVSGSGNVRYGGNAEVSVSKSGSGSVSKI